MEITVLGQNYTGAHFRGIMDPYDSIYVEVTLSGTESEIVQWMSQEFSYNETKTRTLKGYIKSIREGREPMFDGCGGIYKILVGGKKVFDLGDILYMEYDEEDLGEPVKLKITASPENNLNTLVEQELRRTGQ